MPEARVHEGRFIVLRPLEAETDAPELFAISHSNDVARDLWRYLPSGPFDDEKSMVEFLNQWQARPDVKAFTVRRVGDRKCLGTISLMGLRPEHGGAELGYIWYAPEAQRTAANTEACYLLLRYCFEDLRYRRVEWKCNARNERSRAAALRLGFIFEGVFRQHMVIKGENRDTAWFSMLDSEWTIRRDHFEKSLHGGASVSLSQLNLGLI